MKIFNKLILATMLIDVSITSSYAMQDPEDLDPILTAEEDADMRPPVMRRLKFHDNAAATGLEGQNPDFDMLESDESGMQELETKRKQSLALLDLPGDIKILNFFQLSAEISQITDINAINRFGNTVLHDAVIRNDIDFVETLLSTRADVNINATNQFGQTVLHVAVQKGHIACLKMLLMTKINVNAVDMFGFTALHLAAEKGRADCIQVLLNTPKVNINATDTFGHTALYFAKLNKHENCVQMLKIACEKLIVRRFQVRF